MCLRKIDVGTVKQVDVLIQKVENCIASNGTTYQKVYLIDEDGETIMANSFNEELQEGVVKATVSCAEYNGGKSYKITSTEISEVDKSAFMPKAKIDIKAEWEYLISEIKGLPNSLRNLCCRVLQSLGTKKYMTAPLTSDSAYSRLGGLLESTTKMVRLSKVFAKELPVNAEVLTTVAILYNCGVCKTIEDFTDAPSGLLVNHKMETFSIVKTAILESDEDFQDDKALIILNALSSGYEMPSSNMTIESIIIKHINYLVRKADIVDDVISSEDEGSFIKSDKTTYYKPFYKFETEDAE